jgi:hypothetical protein
MRRVAVAVALALCAGFVATAFADPMPAPPRLVEPAPGVRFGGGDGSSCDAAVVISGAEHERDGIRAQRWWIWTKNPDAKIESQSTSSQGGRDLETFVLLLPGGVRKTTCFDITSFYGKP